MSTRSDDLARSAAADRVPSEAAIRDALADVLGAPLFAHAPRLSRFLEYIVNESLAGRAEAIKEYALAADVFGRGADYDSSTDAIVRVEAGRLRQKLHAYYDGAGAAAGVEIDLPKGSYVPAFRMRAPATPAPPPRLAAKRSSPVWYVVAVMLGAVVVASVAMLGTRGAIVATRPVESASADPQALADFLEGQYLRNQMTLPSIRAAVEAYSRAVAHDPASAAAWAALGEARATLLFHEGAATDEGIGQARRDIERALALRPTLAEARGVLARLELAYGHDWTRAEPEFRRALGDAPNNARLHQWFAFALASRGRFPEALEASRRATELNPAAYVGTTDAAMLLFFARRYGDALDAARQAHAMNASMSVAHVVAGMCLVAAGRHSEAITEYQQALEGDTTFTAVHAKLAHAYGLMGERREAERHAESLRRAFGDAPIPAVDRALVAIGRNDVESAMAALENGFERREGDIVFFDVHPLLDPLRAHPRFAALRQRAGM